MPNQALQTTAEHDSFFVTIAHRSAAIDELSNSAHYPIPDHGGNSRSKTDTTTANNIDEYIAAFPNDVQGILQKMRGIIKKAAPDAEEAIKYQIPTIVCVEWEPRTFCGLPEAHRVLPDTIRPCRVTFIRSLN